VSIFFRLSPANACIPPPFLMADVFADAGVSPQRRIR